MTAFGGDVSIKTLVRIQLRDGRRVSGEYLDGEIWVDGVSYRESDVRYMIPASPAKLVCVGVNYRDHAEEMGMRIPAEPLIFLKPTTSLIAHEEPVRKRPEVTRLDYEAELTVVIGRTARLVSEQDAMQFVAGLTLANDVTARNFQQPDTQWTKAKGYDTFAPVGPGIVQTAEWAGRKITATLNGRVVQSSNTDQLIFGVPKLISYISSIMTLDPGDLILTGTPGGVGPMNDGDVVEIGVEGLGVLRNSVVADGR
jgi:2-keto-4-pentenoate hydratase/2-oxohepta-3-ene-1,7-dioic acid hydratase in catechol pathway